MGAFALYARMPIEIIEVDHADTLRLAETLGLSSDDAAYLWLAQKLTAELVTLRQKAANRRSGAALAICWRKGATALGDRATLSPIFGRLRRSGLHLHKASCVYSNY